MQFLHDPRSSCQVAPPNNLLTGALRLTEDIEPRHARIIAHNLGGDPDLLIQAGYRLVTGAFAAAFRQQGFELPKFVKVNKTILLPCRNQQGVVAGLHDEQRRWIFGPASHVSNPKRATYESIRICRSTSEADSLALSQNVCVVVAHGKPIIDLLQRLSGESLEVAA